MWHLPLISDCQYNICNLDLMEKEAANKNDETVIFYVVSDSAIKKIWAR